MKQKIRILFFTFYIFVQGIYSQTVDTLVDVGNHKLHFRIIKGEGLPILFESGAGNDGSVWDTILKPIREITNATLITYDRAGIGSSTIDTNKNQGVLDDLHDLETALIKIGYNKEIMLVSHSYGGYINTLYSNRHPDLVKAVILVDVNLNFWEKFEEKDKLDKQLEETKGRELGLYYLTLNFPQTVKIMSEISIPKHIPVVDFVNGISFLEKPEMKNYWIECHKTFVTNRPNSIGITAHKCGHFIWMDNPLLIISTISKLYAETLGRSRTISIYERNLKFNIVSLSEDKNRDYSNEKLNNWGYEFLNNGEYLKALDIFKLIITLYPSDWNAYDSCGEALLKLNRKEEAIKMYTKSVELNPENKSGMKTLMILKKK